MPALDGLRGLAVLGVLLFHADGLLPGGYLGVDLFFVLSGYLITSILLAEHEHSGQIALRTFWVRRARRLVPALLGIMPAVALYARLLARPDEVRGLRIDALATLAYVANWRVIFQKKSYWDLFVAPSPLEHTWSLAIEEQFYVLWPLVVLLVLVGLRGSRRAMFWLSSALAVASSALMFFLYDPAHVSRVYQGTDTRAGGILAGAALAAILAPGARVSDRGQRALGLLGVLSLALLGVAWVKLDGQSPFLYRGGFWLTEAAVLAVIAAGVAAPGSLVARLLSLRPLTLVGSISYGVYLWHWPVFVVLTRERLHLAPLWVQLVRFAVTFAIAGVSYRLLEKPIRSRGVFFGPPGLVVPGAFALTIGLVLWGTRPRTAMALAHAGGPSSATYPDWPGIYSVSSRQIPPASALPPGVMRLLVLGDSQARFLGLALRYQQEKAQVFVGERGVGSCTILVSEHRVVDGLLVEGESCATDWTRDAAELRPDATFIVLGGGFLGDRTCEPAWRADYKKRLLYLVESISPEAGRIILARVPYPMGRWRHSNMIERVNCFNATLDEVAAESRLPMLDLVGHVCPTTDCIFESQGAPLRPDGLHFDGLGAEETARWTLGELRRIVRESPAPPGDPASSPAPSGGPAASPSR
jgi:peptidoglycan/LPS O-acetylase OafA/YrhL/lysophospholipase L1-like esterase